MNNRVKPSIFIIALLAVVPCGSAFAQQAPAKPASIRVPMRVQFVLSTYQGEKKIGSLPYTLSLNSSDAPTQLNVGAKVPTPTVVVNATTGGSTPSYTYNQIGVSIRCSVAVLDDGVFSVTMNVQDSSVFMSPGAGGPTPAGSVNSMPFVNGIPVFKNFEMSSTLLLKDGQTSQLTSAADPVSGDLMKVDVTLTLIK